jgi:hypothetical protein
LFLIYEFCNRPRADPKGGPRDPPFADHKLSMRKHEELKAILLHGK